MPRRTPASQLRIIDDNGHCPHVSAAIASSRAIDAFLLQTLG